MKQKWSKEPWENQGYEKDEGGSSIISGKGTASHISAFGVYSASCPKDRCEANANRIVSCVNTWAGVADPEAELKRLRDENKRLQEYVDKEWPSPHSGECDGASLCVSCFENRALLSKIREQDTEIKRLRSIETDEVGEKL